MIITKELINDCLHSLANTAQNEYKDSKKDREQLMESHTALVTFLNSNHQSQIYYELTPYRRTK